MFFNAFDTSIKIESVHLLTWESRRVRITPKKFFCFSFREIGDSHFQYEDREISAVTGDILYFPKGAGYLLHAGQERLYAVNFSASGTLDLTPGKFAVKNYALFKDLFSELYQVWIKRENGYYLRAMSIFYKILATMEREREENPELALYKKLKPALDRINSHYVDPDLSIGDLAAAIGFSDTYFRKNFERYMGKRPLDYLNGLRIEYARELLESGFYSVEAIASMCGFRDPKYFSTVFKRVSGITPSEYRKKHS